MKRTNDKAGTELTVPAFSVLKKPRRVRRPQAANRVKSFSAATCAWLKILLTLQVWNLSASGRQNPGLPRKRKQSGLRGERSRKGADGGFAVRRNRSRADFAATSAAGCSLFEKVALATFSTVLKPGQNDLSRLCCLRKSCAHVFSRGNVTCQRPSVRAEAV